jgi:hypothetical protein
MKTKSKPKRGAAKTPTTAEVRALDSGAKAAAKQAASDKAKLKQAKRDLKLAKKVLRKARRQAKDSASLAKKVEKAWQDAASRLKKSDKKAGPRAKGKGTKTVRRTSQQQRKCRGVRNPSSTSRTVTPPVTSVVPPQVVPPTPAPPLPPAPAPLTTREPDKPESGGEPTSGLPSPSSPVTSG